MPGEKKKKIVIASVLKPVNDTRMTEKIAFSLTSLGDVSVIGFSADYNSTKVRIINLPYFKRISIKRLLMPWKILRYVVGISPHVFIITTHELLVVAIFARLITGCRLVYDIQENYYRNIKFTSAFPISIRNLVAAYVRVKEIVASVFVTHFFLAERSYQDELSFHGRRYSVIENKVIRPATLALPARNKNAFLFSGTLAESTGVFIAIDLVERLHECDASITLTIVGYCAKPAELSKLVARVANKEFISIIGGSELVPHQTILQHIATASFGIISYPPNPSTSESTPTKLYEYLGYRLPILLIRNARWERICEQYNAACTFDAESIAPREILQTIQNQAFYSTSPEDVYWDSETVKVQSAISRLLSKI